MSFQINMPKTRDYSQKIVKQEQIVYLRDAGYKVMDLHLHTSVSYDVIPSFQVVPRNLYSNMEKKGFDFITFTDHDTMLAYDDFPEMPANLIPGVEIKIQPKRVGRYEECHTLHINVYTLNQNQLQDLQYIASKREFYEFKAYLEASDLPYQLNHPTWCELTDKPDWHYLPDIIKEFDVIEAFNYKRSTWHNHITLKLLAEEYGKGIVGGSDSHTGEPCLATFFKGNDFLEAWDRIKAGDVFLLQQSPHSSLSKKELITVLKQLRDVHPFDLERNGVNFNLGPNLDKLVERLIHTYIHSPRWLIGLQEKFLFALFHTIGDFILKKVFLANDHKTAQHIFSLIRHPQKHATLSFENLV